jgi:hypothetical protein
MLWGIRDGMGRRVNNENHIDFRLLRRLDGFDP